MNLFGISEVALKGRGGGAPLRDGSIVELTGAGRVTDVTMGNLLRSVSAGTTRVLTPELTELLTHAGADMAAFTPLLRAMVTVAEAVADTQHYPSAFLIDQYASFIDGVGKFADGTVRLVHETYNMQVFRTDRARFDIGVSLVVDRLFPGIAALGLSAKQSLQGYTDSAAVLVDQLARMVPDPALVTADFTELLDRLDRSFRDGPNGPALALDVTLRGVPGVAVPLLGGGRCPERLRREDDEHKPFDLRNSVASGVFRRIDRGSAGRHPACHPTPGRRCEPGNRCGVHRCQRSQDR